MPGEIKLVGTGHIRFSRFLKTFSPQLQKEIGKATLKNALTLQTLVRQGIASRKFIKNSDLTILLKGKNMPLVDTKEMINAIEINQKTPFTARVGFLTDSETSHGGPMINVARLLHDGGTITMTPRMRRFLFAKAKERGGGKRTKIKFKSSSGLIRIPPRPFMNIVFHDPAVQALMNKNWEMAVNGAIRKSSK